MQKLSPSHTARTAVLVSLIALVPACAPQESSAQAEEVSAGGARKREIPRVRVVDVERREMVQVLKTTSTLESEREIEVFARNAGVVIDVLVEEGDPVQVGELLARLDSRDQALAVSDAEVALTEAKNAAAKALLAVEEAENNVVTTQRAEEQTKRDYERDRELFEGKQSTARVVSKQAVETSLLAWENARSDHQQAVIATNRSRLEAKAAETAVNRAQVALQRAELALEHMQIVAPFTGVIAERRVRVGNTVGTGEGAFVLTDVDHLRTVFLRPQEELELFSKASERSGSNGHGALTFTATAEAYPGRSFGGFIERVSPTIDPASGQFRITARLDSTTIDGARVLPGMLMRLFIVTDRHPDALVVPKRALRREGERRYVLAVEETGEGPIVKRVDIREGFDDDENVEVLPYEDGALSEETTIVLVGSRDLSDGDRILIDDGTLPDPMSALPQAETDEVSEADGDEEGADEALDDATSGTEE